MKKVFNYAVICAIACSFIVTGCGKSDDAPKVTGTNHSAFTPEQNKTEMEKVSTNMVADMNSVKTAKGITALTSMTSLPFGMKKSSPVSFVSQIVTLAENQVAGKNLMTSIFNVQADTVFNYAANKGEYTWNATAMNWDKKTSTMIIFKFPSTQGGITNNASLTISEYIDKKIALEGEEVFFPTKVALSLKVDNVEELSLSFAAAFKADATPQSVNIALFLRPYTFTWAASNTDTKIGSSFSWKNVATNIFSTGFEFTGDFASLSKIQNEEEMEIGKYLTKATTYIQIADLKLDAAVDVKALSEIKPEPTLEQVNQYIKLNLTWVNDNVKVADVSIYRKVLRDELGIQLKFKDNTTADAAVYFESAAKNLENFINSLDAK